MSLLLTVLCAELLALAQLYAGYGMFPSLSIALSAGVVYLSLPTILALGSLIVCRLHAAIRALAVSMVDRHTYRFSVRTLLVMVLVICIACAWYGDRRQRVRAEQSLLEGEWYAVSTDGVPYTGGTGKPIIVEFNFVSGGDAVDPTQNPKWWDIRTQRGTSHAIYQWEGTRLHVIQVPEGLQRPTSFDVRQRDSQSTEYFLERLHK
jgi:hypothetical protein